jgi:dihydroorotate dehydrogenase electron transfer subunit
MAAMYLLAQRSPQKGIVFVGGRRRVDILCEPEFRALGWDVRVTTDDGSHGEKGLVTQPLIAALGRTVIWPSPPSSPGKPTERGVGGGRGPQHDAGRKIFACGPTPMLKAVGKIAEEFNVPAELSMDEPMCCGVGVCLTCVIPVKTSEGWEYQRTCTEGPVFDSRQILWEASK